MCEGNSHTETPRCAASTPQNAPRLYAHTHPMQEGKKFFISHRLCFPRDNRERTTGAPHHPSYIAPQCSRVRNVYSRHDPSSRNIKKQTDTLLVINNWVCEIERTENNTPYTPRSKNAVDSPHEEPSRPSAAGMPV